MVELKNYMEVCVNDMLPVVVKGLKCCDCEVCRMDMMAIALNNLPPKYVVTGKGQLYAKLSYFHQQFEVDIVSALTNAARIVTERPRH